MKDSIICKECKKETLWPYAFFYCWDCYVIEQGFIHWDGDYDKRPYDVLLHTGEIVKQCYPNAGYMNEMEGKGRKFTVNDIKGIKPVEWEW